MTLLVRAPESRRPAVASGIERADEYARAGHIVMRTVSMSADVEVSVRCAGPDIGRNGRFPAANLISAMSQMGRAVPTRLLIYADVSSRPR